MFGSVVPFHHENNFFEKQQKNKKNSIPSKVENIPTQVRGSKGTQWR